MTVATEAKARVAIAKDVLKHLKCLKVRRGAFRILIGLITQNSTFLLETTTLTICLTFAERYKTDRNRLRAIMLNIIKNKGEFIP
jgi:penicillin-binding protein-related factor A (putative recombinase)